jgi:hypothetical protein
VKDSAYYRRLGGLVIERIDPEMRMSRAMQICATWRSHFAWHLATALRMAKDRHHRTRRVRHAARDVLEQTGQVARKGR